MQLEYNEETRKIGKIKIIDFGFANYLSKLREMPKKSKGVMI